MILPMQDIGGFFINIVKVKYAGLSLLKKKTMP